MIGDIFFVQFPFTDQPLNHPTPAAPLPVPGQKHQTSRTDPGHQLPTPSSEIPQNAKMFGLL